MTYGTASAPFLALRVLKQLVDDDGSKFPLAMSILRENIYVDDVLFGDDDMDRLRQMRQQLCALLQLGGFELRKWASNSAALLFDIDSGNHGLSCDKTLQGDDVLKILGVSWQPSLDVFQFHVVLDSDIPATKRRILSTIAKLFDPLGWVTPVTVTTKMFMQRLWRLKIPWDDGMPSELMLQWKRTIYSNLSALNGLRCPRWTGQSSDTAQCELHGFADASTSAYAAVVYLKIVSYSNQVTITLLAGKSRVAPLTPLSVPRLELSAAVLLSRLMTFIRHTLGLESLPCYCWTDSTIVIAWLKQHPSRWKTFVANRVTEIQSRLPETVWYHVSTDENPADCASRGLLGHELSSHALWWQGPKWLKFSRDLWPLTPLAAPVEANLEARITSLHLAEQSQQWDLADRFSSWPRLLRVTAYVMRFVKLCRRLELDSNATSPGGSALSASEYHTARVFWIRHIQAQLFASDLQALSSQKTLPSKSSLLSLHPFLDQDGIIRVGGRLAHAPVPFPTKHPIVLAAHPLVTLIIVQAHTRALHAGTQLTLSTVRQNFWILRARNLVKAVIHKCITCARERAAIPTQVMGNLPDCRVQRAARSFLHCGLDYAGPVLIRASAGRGITSRKAYIALFICLATKAIHLELVGSYSTSAFLDAYVRFCARRGLPSSIYSDNGTTFVGADRELTVAYRAAIRDPNFLNLTATDQVVWHFIPPSAPHFGGIWEAGVRSIKHHLRRVLGNHTLTFEEFTTLLCKVEACLNSRPLAPLTDSLDEYEPLTPGHFLIGSAITINPEPSLLDLKASRLSRWQLVRQLSERFWKLWTNDYVNTLQQRVKWKKIQPTVKIGQLVLLRNSALPPCKWELGRVTHCHSGADGLTRVVTVKKTATSEYKRPIVKLCLLPIDINDQTD